MTETTETTEQTPTSPPDSPPIAPDVAPTATPEVSTTGTQRETDERRDRDPKYLGRTDDDVIEPETFPLAYVQKLRTEAADNRVKAQRTDDLATRLHASLVAATGRLADPTDLAYDEGHLSDEDALTAAVDDLLTRKPHLASRRVVGDIGQGATQGGETVDLAGMLRRNAS